VWSAGLLFLGALVALAGCDAKDAPGDAGATAPNAPTPEKAKTADPFDGPVKQPGGDEVQPAYPITKDPPDPRAQRLCEALNELPVKRKAECCATAPGFMQTSECTRALSYALKSGAVTVDDAAIAACSEAMARAHEGCGWVGLNLPNAPDACQGILRGTLKEKAECRSSLECEAGLSCLGVGPTTKGTCQKPRAKGFPCGMNVDPLAGYVRQTSYEAAHPDCAGYCGRRRCDDLVPVGGECETSEACGAGKACVQKKCSAAPLPEAGKACLEGVCAKGARCVAGRCVTPKPKGEACESDQECVGACAKPDGAKAGTCEMRCVITSLLPSKPPPTAPALKR
jgi:hypothetical protein